MLSGSCNPKLQFLRDNALLKDEYALDISDSKKRTNEQIQIETNTKQREDEITN